MSRVFSAHPGAGGQPSPCAWTGSPVWDASAGAGWLCLGWPAHLSWPRSWFWVVRFCPLGGVRFLTAESTGSSCVRCFSLGLHGYRPASGAPLTETCIFLSEISVWRRLFSPLPSVPPVLGSLRLSITSALFFFLLPPLWARLLLSHARQTHAPLAGRRKTTVPHEDANSLWCFRQFLKPDTSVLWRCGGDHRHLTSHGGSICTNDGKHRFFLWLSLWSSASFMHASIPHRAINISSLLTSTLRHALVGGRMPSAGWEAFWSAGKCQI